MPTLGLDLDCVLAELHAPWSDEVFSKTGHRYDKAGLAVYEMHLACPELGRAIYDHMHPHLYDRCPPEPGAVEAVAWLRDQGVTLVVGSVSSDAAMDTAKLAWLDRIFPGAFADVRFFRPGQSKGEGLVDCDFLVDDYPENLKGFQGEKILFNQPWNQSAEMFRLPDWPQGLPLLARRLGLETGLSASPGGHTLGPVKSPSHLSMIWDMADVLREQEPRFTTRDGYFDFDFIGRVDGRSFNRIRANPDADKSEVRVLLQYTHADSAFVSAEWETSFPLRTCDLTGDAKSDAWLYAGRLQIAVQKLYLQHEKMDGVFRPQLEAAFAPEPGAERPLLAFLDRAAAVQKSYDAMLTGRVIALSDHLRDRPEIPRIAAPPLSPAAPGGDSSLVRPGR
jgi:5'(3')-deoxyribonucleotidase